MVTSQTLHSFSEVNTKKKLKTSRQLKCSSFYKSQEKNQVLQKWCQGILPWHGVISHPLKMPSPLITGEWCWLNGLYWRPTIPHASSHYLGSSFKQTSSRPKEPVRKKMKRKLLKCVPPELLCSYFILVASLISAGFNYTSLLLPGSKFQ